MEGDDKKGINFLRKTDKHNWLRWWLKLAINVFSILKGWPMISAFYTKLERLSSAVFSLLSTDGSYSTVQIKLSQCLATHGKSPVTEAGTIGSVRYLSRHCLGARLSPSPSDWPLVRRAVSNPRPGPDRARQRFGPGALILSRRWARDFTPRYLPAIMNAEKSSRLVARRRRPAAPDAASQRCFRCCSSWCRSRCKNPEAA